MIFVLLTAWDAEAAEGHGGLVVWQQQARILPPSPPLREKALAEGLRSEALAL